MTDWTSGYVADIGYTFGYYGDLNPLKINLAFLNAGLVPPEIGTACELGFGQGMSVNMHAAASVVNWHGTDFNPSQAGFAIELAEACNNNCQLFDQAFDEFCNRNDLPDFDYIALHGIWSWISDENRQVIVDFIRKKLKVGGVLYISYNTQPGWASMVPMRELLTEHSEVMGSDGAGIVNRINNSLDFAEKLLATNPKFAAANPVMAERIKNMKEQNRQYLAHEYFNRDWAPMSFSKMATWLEGAKVQWACSANYLDAVDDINLTKEQQQLLSEIPDPMFQQTVRDFCVNQQFRKDYWVKGKRSLTAFEQIEKLRMQRVVLTTARQDVSLKMTGSLGEVNMHENVYNPILDALADQKVKTIGELEQLLCPPSKDAKISFAQLMQAILVLIGGNSLSAALDETTAQKAKKRADNLNGYLIRKARNSGDIGTLCSPVLGGGLPVSRFHQLFILALQSGQKSPIELAKFAWAILKPQGQRLIKDGKSLETDEQNLEFLGELSQEFADKRLAVLKALKII